MATCLIAPRVVRGGHWDADPEDCRSAKRWATSKKWKRHDAQLPKSIWWHTDVRAYANGFRIIQPVKDPPRTEKTRCWDPDFELIRKVIENDEKQARILVNGPDRGND